jgi:hypothetical protein
MGTMQTCSCRPGQQRVLSFTSCCSEGWVAAARPTPDLVKTLCLQHDDQVLLATRVAQAYSVDTQQDHTDNGRCLLIKSRSKRAKGRLTTCTEVTGARHSSSSVASSRQPAYLHARND